MARLYNYHSSREVLAGLYKGDDVVAMLSRVPIFILERCGIRIPAEDYETFKEAVSKCPLLFDFALSRFIQSSDPIDQVRYYIPKSFATPWGEYGVYYHDLFPYDYIKELYNQECGFYEFYLTRDSERDVYNLYFEDLYDLKYALDRFIPTDILIGSYVEEKILRVRKRNYAIPNRIEPVKIEIKSSDLHIHCSCNLLCPKCWMFLCLSANALTSILTGMELEVEPFVIFNGLDGYIVSFKSNDENSYKAMSNLVNGMYSTNLDFLNTQAQTVLDITNLFKDIHELKEHLIPDFTQLEYNSYTRFPYSINSNSYKICIPITSESYKILYTEVPTVYDLLNEKFNIKDFRF